MAPVFDRTGTFDWQDACRLLVEHPKHASFFVTKLWAAFVPTPPDAATRAALERIYVDGDHQVKPVLRAILKHPTPSCALRAPFAGGCCGCRAV